jgi:hypothetical protein
MANDQDPRRVEQEQVEQRSLTGAVVQTLNDVKQGAGWTLGAVIVGGAVKKGSDVLGKGDKK